METAEEVITSLAIGVIKCGVVGSVENISSSLLLHSSPQSLRDLDFIPSERQVCISWLLRLYKRSERCCAARYTDCDPLPEEEFALPSAYLLSLVWLAMLAFDKVDIELAKMGWIGC